VIRLALLRHAPTAWNRAGRLQGRRDLPLDAAARADLAALALPAAWQGAEVVASPLVRAVETATILTGRRPRLEPALMEIDWGAWEGLCAAELRAEPASGYRDIEHWGWDFRPPGGESPAELRARLLPFLAGLTRDTLAVTHAGVIRCLLALAWHWDYRGQPPFRVQRGRLAAVSFRAGAPEAMVPAGEAVRLVARAAGGGACA
jgi:probable phosphoglycerate mutase